MLIKQNSKKNNIKKMAFILLFFSSSSFSMNVELKILENQQQIISLLTGIEKTLEVRNYKGVNVQKTKKPKTDNIKHTSDGLIDYSSHLSSSQKRDAYNAQFFNYDNKNPFLQNQL